jgi:hypothetical protein
MRNLDSLLAVHPWRKLKDVLIAGAIAAITVGTLAVLSKKPVSRPFVVLTAKVERVQVKLPEWRGFSWSGAPVQINAANGVRLTGFEFPGWRTLSGARSGEPACPYALHLDSFVLGAGALLILEYDSDGRVIIGGEGAEMRGELECKGSPDAPAELADFLPKARATTRQTVSLSLLQPLTIEKVAIRELSLVRQLRSGTTQGDRPTVSSIQSGSLRFVETDQEIALRKGDRLNLVNISGDIDVAAYPGERSMTLRYEGTVDAIWRDNRDLTPSWLFYWRRNANFAMFLGAFAAVWGALWTIRRWLSA